MDFEAEFTFLEFVPGGTRDLISDFKTVDAQPQAKAGPIEVLEHPCIRANSSKPSTSKNLKRLL